MIVLYDQNEGVTNPKFIDILLKAFPQATSQNLEFGDINIILDTGDLLSIERKNVSDFLGSIADGRVFRQVEQMQQGAKFSCVLLVGEMYFDENDMTVVNGKETEWKGSSVRGAMLAIQYSGCPFYYANNYQSAINAIHELAKFCSKPQEHFQLRHNRVITFPPVDQRVQILAGFPNIGIKKSEALLKFAKIMVDDKSSSPDDELGTLAAALCFATIMPFFGKQAKPDGWGEKIVEMIRIQLGLKQNEYLDIVTEEERNKRVAKEKYKKKSGEDNNKPVTPNEDDIPF